MKQHKWSKLAEAFDFASMAHQHQLRKSTNIPYISHIMSVSALVLEHGGNEDQAIAGLLHDVIEDADSADQIPQLRSEILNRFGPKVLELVEGCTDGVPDAAGNKSDWKTRKEAYLAHLEDKSVDLLLVSCCDKLHNARSILTDLVTHGNAVFDRFSAKQSETLWYYQSLSNIYSRRLTELDGKIAAREFARTVMAIKRIARK